MTRDADVIIIGAGPVGLSAAMDLDSRGVSVIVVESRPYLQPPSVKSNHVAARTMERFRTLGVAQKVRQAGLPDDYPNDVAFRTVLTGTEIGRIHIPARRDRYKSDVGPDTGWPTPEPPHRINQTFLEPILVEHVAGLPNVTLLNETMFLSYRDSADGVTVLVSGGSDGQERTLSARFLIGADGGRSAVRKQMGASLSGDPVLQHVQSTCIEAPGLPEAMPGEPAWGYYTYNPRRNGHVYAIDGHATFLIHNHLSDEEAENGTVDRDWSIRTILGVDDEFEYRILSEEDWVARRLVADRLRAGNVFICGDAAHLWVPYGGYGMNAGIADAFNLGWVLGAYLQGWGGEGILDAYEAERLPITAQVSKFAMEHQRRTARFAVPPEIEDDTEAGAAARQAAGKLAYEVNVRQFAAEGLNFGYSYDGSPLIAYDGESAPAYTMSEYTPSTAPGCRAPHLWLEPGVSLYDRFGSGYTLLRFDPVIDIEPLMGAAGRAGMPLTVIDVDRSSAPSAYHHGLVLCRQDQHVAWRGDVVPADSVALVRILSGTVTRTL